MDVAGSQGARMVAPEITDTNGDNVRMINNLLEGYERIVYFDYQLLKNLHDTLHL